MIKVAYLGSGPISHFHFSALSNVGFVISCVWSGRVSDRSRAFAVHTNAYYCNSDDDFLSRAKSCDAIIICLNTSVTARWLIKLSKLEKPIFCEKPGGITSNELATAKSAFRNPSLVRFAYNRRFYKPVQNLKNIILKEGFESAVFIWPDTVAGFDQLIINGCHAIDILYYLFGELMIKDVTGNSKDGVFVHFADKSDRSILFVDPWSKPRNAELIVFSKSGVHTLKPLEFGFSSTKMEVVEPTDTFPLRRYTPNQIDESFVDNNFKPGFISQYISFKNFVENGVSDDILCTFDQAITVLLYIDEIIARGS